MPPPPGDTSSDDDRYSESESESSDDDAEGARPQVGGKRPMMRMLHGAPRWSRQDESSSDESSYCSSSSSSSSSDSSDEGCDSDSDACEGEPITCGVKRVGVPSGCESPPTAKTPRRAVTIGSWLNRGGNTLTDWDTDFGDEFQPGWDCLKRKPWVAVMTFTAAGSGKTESILSGDEYKWSFVTQAMPPTPSSSSDTDPLVGFDYGSRPMHVWEYDVRTTADALDNMGSRHYNLYKNAMNTYVCAPPPRTARTDISPHSIISNMSYLPWKRMSAFFAAIGCGEMTRSRYPQMFEARSFCGCPTKVISKAVTRGLLRSSHAVRNNVTASAVLPFARGKPVVTDAFMFALRNGFVAEVHAVHQLAAAVIPCGGARTAPCTILSLATRVDPVTLAMTVCARPDIHIGTAIRRMRHQLYASWHDEYLTQQFITMRTNSPCPSSAVRELTGCIITHMAVIMSPLVEVHHAYAPDEIKPCPSCNVTPVQMHHNLDSVPACSMDTLTALYAAIRARPNFARSFTRAISPIFEDGEAHTIDAPPACGNKRYAIACMWAIICDMSLVSLIHAQHPGDARDVALPKVDNMVRAFTIFALKLAKTRNVPSFDDAGINDTVNRSLAGLMECITIIAVHNVRRFRVFKDGRRDVDSSTFVPLKIGTRVCQGEGEERQVRMSVCMGASKAADDWVGGTPSMAQN